MEASEKGRSWSMNPAPDHLGQMEKKVATRGSRAGPLPLSFLPPSLPQSLPPCSLIQRIGAVSNACLIWRER